MGPTTSSELLFILVGVPILRCASSFGDRRFMPAGEEASCPPAASQSVEMAIVDSGRTGASVAPSPNSRGGTGVGGAPPPSTAEGAARLPNTAVEVPPGERRRPGDGEQIGF